MGRPVVLSNGQMFVGLDENGLVHDFYYPYVGLENLTTSRSMHHKIGISIGKKFSWTDDGSWKIDVLFETDALISDVQMRNPKLGITLYLQDTIDSGTDIFLRRVRVENTSPKKRKIRLFMHQVFQISNNGRSDTALFVPDTGYILDYKGRFCLAVGGQHEDGSPFDQYAIGNYGIEGKESTFKDAEDGELSNNPVEHGGVDSVLRFTMQLDAHGIQEAHYWIAAASNQRDAEVMHIALKDPGEFDSRIHQTRLYWQQWLRPSDARYAPIPNAGRIVVQQSLMLIKAHCDSRGSILASGDSSIFNYGRDYYGYCWPRDAAYALWPLIRTGHFDEAKQFFLFAYEVMHPDGYMMHKYQPDRAIGSTWHPLLHNHRTELAIQEDETAIVLFMLNEFYEASKDIEYVASLYDTFVTPCANFLATYVDAETGLPHASYDLWEQRFATFTYTVCSVIAGLEAASKLALALSRNDDAETWSRAALAMRANLDSLYHPDGYFRKSLLIEDGKTEYNDTVDIANMYGPFMFAQLPLHDIRMQSTVQKIEQTLLDTGPVGGVIRYPGDDYFLEKKKYGGNPWLVATLWLAQYYISARRSKDAEKLIDWVLKRRLPSGVLGEQSDPETGEPLGVAPLIWSHAELVNTILDYYEA